DLFRRRVDDAEGAALVGLDPLAVDEHAMLHRRGGCCGHDPLFLLAWWLLSVIKVTLPAGGETSSDRHPLIRVALDHDVAAVALPIKAHAALGLICPARA